MRRKKIKQTPTIAGVTDARQRCRGVAGRSFVRGRRTVQFVSQHREILATFANGLLILVHGQLTIIFVVSVCLFVCAEFLSRL